MLSTVPGRAQKMSALIIVHIISLFSILSLAQGSGSFVNKAPDSK